MAENKIVYFAKTNFRGNERTFGVRTPDRRQHMYVIGKTGTGKTNLLKNLALQDIANGDGIAIVDPHGSFVEEVLASIPEERIADVIYFNPSDTDYPIAFNVLEVPDPKYKHLVASDLMGIFTKIWANVWSARMEYILNNCILALLDTPGTTLLGIPRMLVDKDYRRKIVENIKDPIVRSFWTQEYEGYTDRLRSEAIVPIQNKVGQFLSSSLIRNIVGQEHSTINIPDVMNQRKILLVNVSKGRIGEDNAALLGAMLITKIQLAAMERVRIPEEERKDFYLYVDEFQNFATESFASILSEARKYRLDITIAHQYIGQLVSETTTKVRDAVFGNVGTMIVFRVGAADAEFLENEFVPEFEIQDFVNLPNYHIYIKLMVNGITSRPFSATTIPAKLPLTVPDSSEAIIEFSRKKYSVPREGVESAVARWSGVMGDDVGAGGFSSPRDGKPKEERYTTTCSVCGKPAHVNFKPDPNRPVYCSDCLKKVQAGQITPPTLKQEMAPAKSESFGASLGALGIAFDGESRPARAPHSVPHRPAPPKSMFQQ
jgi:CxxC-x17-CxxC domain-containing protein